MLFFYHIIIINNDCTGWANFFLLGTFAISYDISGNILKYHKKLQIAKNFFFYNIEFYLLCCVV